MEFTREEILGQRLTGPEREQTKKEEDKLLLASMKSRYDLKNSDIVIDTKTGLIWAKNSDIAGRSMNWNEAMTWVQNLSYAGKTGWRLPSKEEWDDFVNIGDDNNTGWHENMARLGVMIYNLDGNYWSSSTNPVNTDFVWAMSAGLMTGRFKHQNGYAWPVHSGN